MLAEMEPESESAGGRSRAAEVAGRALESLAEMEPELKQAAIFRGEGDPAGLLAATGDAAWTRSAAVLARSVRDAAEAGFDSAHIALEEGEVFVVAESGHTLVAATGRFVLAALTRFDARMCLRDLAAETGPDAGDGGPQGEMARC